MRGRILPTMALVGAYLFGSQASAQPVQQTNYPSSSSIYICDKTKQTALVNDPQSLELLAGGLESACIKKGENGEDCQKSTSTSWKSTLRTTLDRTVKVEYNGTNNTVTFTSARGSSTFNPDSNAMTLVLSAARSYCN